MKPTHPSEIMNSSITDSIDCDSKIYARHVSAIQLSQSTAPDNLKQHSKMNTNDKTIWDKAYLEKYMGLPDKTKTWVYITEYEFLLLRPIIGNAIAINKQRLPHQGDFKQAFCQSFLPNNEQYI